MARRLTAATAHKARGKDTASVASTTTASTSSQGSRAAPSLPPLQLDQRTIIRGDGQTVFTGVRAIPGYFRNALAELSTEVRPTSSSPSMPASTHGR